MLSCLIALKCQFCFQKLSMSYLTTVWNRTSTQTATQIAIAYYPEATFKLPYYTLNCWLCAYLHDVDLETFNNYLRQSSLDFKIFTMKRRVSTVHLAVRPSDYRNIPREETRKYFQFLFQLGRKWKASILITSKSAIKEQPENLNLNRKKFWMVENRTPGNKEFREYGKRRNTFLFRIESTTDRDCMLTQA